MNLSKNGRLAIAIGGRHEIMYISNGFAVRLFGLIPCSEFFGKPRVHAGLFFTVQKIQ